MIAYAPTGFVNFGPLAVVELGEPLAIVVVVLAVIGADAALPTGGTPYEDALDDPPRPTALAEGKTSAFAILFFFMHTSASATKASAVSTQAAPVVVSPSITRNSFKTNRRTGSKGKNSNADVQ